MALSLCMNSIGALCEIDRSVREDRSHINGRVDHFLCSFHILHYACVWNVSWTQEMSTPSKELVFVGSREFVSVITGGC